MNQQETDTGFNTDDTRMSYIVPAIRAMIEGEKYDKAEEFIKKWRQALIDIPQLFKDKPHLGESLDGLSNKLCNLLIENAKLQLKSNDIIAAKKTTDSIVSLKPDASETNKRLVSMLLKLGDNNTALDVATRMAENKPESTKAQLSLLKIYIAQGNHTAASEQIGVLMDVNTSDKMGRHKRDDLRKVLTPLQGLEASKTLAEKIIKKNPLDPVGYIQLSAACLGLKDPEGARAAAEKAISLDPENVNAYTLLSQSCINLKDFESARDAAEKATKLDYKNSNGFTLLAGALLGLGEAEAAATKLRTVIEHYEQNPLAHCLLSQALLKMGDPKGAFDQAEIAIGFQPENSKFHNQLSYTLLALDDKKLARDALEKACDLDPQNAKYLGRLITINVQINDFEAAEKTIEKLRQIEENNDYALGGEIYLALAQGDVSKAFNSVKKLLKDDYKPYAMKYYKRMLDHGCGELSDRTYYNQLQAFALEHEIITPKEYERNKLSEKPLGDATALMNEISESFMKEDGYYASASDQIEYYQPKPVSHLAAIGMGRGDTTRTAKK